jgi:hypothetical protein
MSLQPLQPRKLLGVLTDSGVEFTVIGAPSTRTNQTTLEVRI